ncbi:hypothetical protein M409DRAFT_23335 [Zasmidium cellare ATCC 36951]|uniref:Uncharacterized protein n=1 Tax=Zasmidium cellare ATCC 36951 TaxID=1080233 RepID=A0A6A6CG63_ZASCE|nr:uncharacterized protein M409DRAFT_23335 [Zasmidium cellare ATCC 36951]KAF2166145.1 hypothetical protein M409DRAFT_23335 [Zasmidium cellare ATCC 36951]
MSSKFFTWGHKGDKKPSAYGVVPIPAECITIHGIENKGTHKSRRKPLPLDLYHTPDPSAIERNRADDSIAFHDAAVQSATSLLAVINDCLKSPPLSAHFQPSQQPPGLQPMYGRPRSRTAPSTPMAEAPPGRQMSPVELPGSMPVVKRSHASHQSMDSRALRTIMTSPNNASSLGHSIERPHSSPQETTYQLPSYPRQSSDSFARSVTSLQPPTDPVPRSKTSSPHKRSRSTKPSLFNTSDDTLVGSESDAPLLPPKCPASRALSTHPNEPLNVQSAGTMPRLRSARPAGWTPSSTLTEPVYKRDKQPTWDTEAFLVDQISAMRVAHDAHLKSLKETHEKEIASHRSYVSFLERRLTVQSVSQQVVKQHLTIDTSHLPNKDPSLLSSEGSATTSMQSFEMTLEGQKRASTEAMAEAQKLRKERDHFKESAERHERKVTQLRGITRKATDNETALKNAISGLEASLQAANIERLDVLEGFHEACEQVRVLGKARDEFRDRLYYVDPIWKETASVDVHLKDLGQLEELVQRHKSLRQDELLQQLDDVRQQLSERSLQIRALEQQLAGSQPVDRTPLKGTDHTNEKELERCRQQLAATKADRDRYNDLLHTELRRQSRLAAQRTRTVTPQLETEALTAMRERLKALKDTSDASDANVEDLPSSTLERELEHCFQEIIMYKLDIKGYKKDLKTVNAELEKLRVPPGRDRPSNGAMVSTPQRNAALPSTSEVGAGSTHDPSPGLGITMPPPLTTPQRNTGAATAPAFLSTNTTPQHQPHVLSPAHRPKTPLGVHKKLPKPPPQSRTPSPYLPFPPPRAEVQRQETLRSLSESIISSYAKRSTPEQKGLDTTPPPRGRSSDPPRVMGRSEKSDEGSNAKAVPMAKFTPRMLRTPVKGVGAGAV